MKEVYTWYVYFMFDKFKNFIIGDGDGGAVQKVVRGPENLIYGFDCNISGFYDIVFRLLSSGLRPGVVLSELGYSPVSTFNI
jgi:hypothetical protein